MNRSFNMKIAITNEYQLVTFKEGENYLDHQKYDENISEFLDRILLLHSKNKINLPEDERTKLLEILPLLQNAATKYLKWLGHKISVIKSYEESEGSSMRIGYYITKGAAPFFYSSVLLKNIHEITDIESIYNPYIEGFSIDECESSDYDLLTYYVSSHVNPSYINSFIGFHEKTDGENSNDFI